MEVSTLSYDDRANTMKTSCIGRIALQLAGVHTLHPELRNSAVRSETGRGISEMSNQARPFQDYALRHLRATSGDVGGYSVGDGRKLVTANEDAKKTRQPFAMPRQPFPRKYNSGKLLRC